MEEKLALAHELWDEFASSQGLEEEMSPTLWDAIQERIEINNSLPMSTWEDMVARIRSN